jgi:hypothetical protein
LAKNRDNEEYSQYTEKYKELKEKLSKEYSRKSSLRKIKRDP